MKRRVISSVAIISLLLVGRLAIGAVGRTPGQFAVSQTGSAQYTIPLFSPSGPHGMQPSVALFYDSYGGIGPLGVGWSISGLGEITRCNKTVAQDGTAGPVALVVADGYCMNGKRLRLTSGTYGQNGSTYQTEIADFTQISAVGTAGNGPQYWKVLGPNGFVYYYGFVNTPANSGIGSQVLAGNSGTTALTWLLSQVIDTSGNSYAINYTNFSGLLVGTAVPSSISWANTTAGGSTYAYSMQFIYSPNPAQSTLNKNVAGTQVSNPKLLSSIEVQINPSTIVKDYFLGYNLSSTTGREELTTVQECPNTTQSNSNCLAATTIGYAGPTRGVITTASNALSSSGSGLTARYDFNGDGIPDLLFNNGTNWMVALGTGSGYSTPFSTTIPASAVVLPGNLNGASQDGILASSGTSFYYYTWSVSGFTKSTTAAAPYDSTVTTYQLADIDGDGLPDLVSLNVAVGASLTVRTRLNTTTSATTVSFNSTLSTAYTYSNTSLIAAALQTPDSQFGKLRRFDFNGDGRDDVALIIDTPGVHSDQLTTFELISNGTTFSASQIAISPGGTFAGALFVNWNDDSCTDYVFQGTLHVAGCDGSVAATYTVTGTVVAAMDWDGDGRTDLVVATGGTGTDLQVLLSTAGTSPTSISTTLTYNSACQYIIMDTTGGGLDDLGCWISAGSTAITYYPHYGLPDLANSITDGYLNSVSPTYVSIVNSNYSPLPTGTLANYAEQTFPLRVVSVATFSDPTNPGAVNDYTQSYYYYGAWVNLQGRGFQSFYGTRQIDSRNGLWDFKYYERAFPQTGMLFQEVLSNSAGAYIHVTNNTPATTNLSITSGQQRYFNYFSNVSTTQEELGGTKNGNLITSTSTDYTYDSYGNALTITSTVTDNDTDPNNPYRNDYWTTAIVNTPDIKNNPADATAGCLNLIDKTVTTYSSNANFATSVMRTQSFTPDPAIAKCRIQTTTTEPGNTQYQVTETLGFDTTFGNVVTDTVTGSTMPNSPASRVTSYNWGTTGQFLNYVIDPSGAKTVWTYTSNQALTFGVPDSMQDPNNTSLILTKWGYDAFGRKLSAVLPDNTTIGWQWLACSAGCGLTPATGAYQIQQVLYQTDHATRDRTDTTTYDALDRVVETSGPTVSGAIANVLTTYNNLGLRHTQSMPFFSGTADLTTYQYDPLNRLVSVSRPVSATKRTSTQTTSYAYAGRLTTTTDYNGNNTTVVNDVNGALRQTKDALGYTVTRVLDAAGTMYALSDSVGNSLLHNATVAYGIRPFITAATDDDLGKWTYTYDSLGELTNWSDANTNTFSMAYDALSRPVSRTEPDLYTEWMYGNSSPNWGKLTNECTVIVATSNLCTNTATSWLYNESRTYDNADRLLTRTITQSGNTAGNDGGGAFKFTYGYSGINGLLASIMYPKSSSSYQLNIQYAYQNRLLYTVTDATDGPVTLWTANTQDAFGHVSKATFGNGLVSNLTYDAVTSWLTKATSGVGGGSALINQSYLQDKNGNVIQRQATINQNVLTENFFYDGDNRLCSITSGTSCTSDFTYDATGSIKTQAGVGTYNYPAAGQPQSHAVTSITGTFNGWTNPSFGYDGNGNMIKRASASQNIYWSTYNYPTTITAGSETITFQYGPDRQRWQQVDGGETTYYVGNSGFTAPANVEAVFSGGTITYRHYIYAGNQSIAVDNYSSGAATLSYLLPDHEGSVAAISDSSGAPTGATYESFAAFGSMRNSSTWSGAPDSGELGALLSKTRQGYTFQTTLGQSVGLVHMNGRVEDALIGRMMSPDPTNQDSGNAQNYNRFSYVLNNPLTFIDPSGFKTECREKDNGYECEVDSTGDRDPNPHTSPDPTDWLSGQGQGGTGGGSGAGNGAPASIPVDAPAPVPIQAPLTQQQCRNLAASLGFGDNFSPPSSNLDDGWSIGTGVSLAPDAAMAARGYIRAVGSRAIGGRSVGATLSGLKTGTNIIGGVGVAVSVYQAGDAFSSGDKPTGVISSADAIIGVGSFFIKAADIPVASYFLGRILGDIAYSALNPPPPSVLERAGTLQAAGCL